MSKTVGFFIFIFGALSGHVASSAWQFLSISNSQNTTYHAKLTTQDLEILKTEFANPVKDKNVTLSSKHVFVDCKKANECEVKF